jgi:crotonobetainyl-CoA:carnitine CoA-transferase CaiB-like acyl-CoA transferase
MPDAPRPLEGLLVADFSRVLAGPFASMTLGDLGAEVVKVERPDGGDDTRAWGPPWRDDQSTYFLGLNRNKRSVALDLGDPEDLELARRLAQRADVMLESFRPGLMARWGLDGDTLRKANPRLVTCSITAFGTGEAGAALPGYDFLLQAMGGLMSITGEPDGRPVKVGSAVVDLVCGLLAVVGIQAALVERERTGRGRHVEVSLMDAVLTAQLNQGSAWVAGGSVAGRMGNRHPSIVPYETFDASDRPLAVAVGNDRMFARLCTALGLDELPGDPDFATNQSRVANAGALRERLASRFAGATAAEWVAQLTAASVPAGLINRIDEAWELAESLGMEPVAEVDGIPLAAPPLRLDGERPAVRRAPPRLDEHGDDIRSWLRED